MDKMTTAGLGYGRAPVASGRESKKSARRETGGPRHIAIETTELSFYGRASKETQSTYHSTRRKRQSLSALILFFSHPDTGAGDGFDLSLLFFGFKKRGECIKDACTYRQNIMG